MSFQSLTWPEIAAITCPVCFEFFNETDRRPIAIGCGHTVCKYCIKHEFKNNSCPFDQFVLPDDADKLPANYVLMPLVEKALLEEAREEAKEEARRRQAEGIKEEMDGAQCYERAASYVQEMAEHLKPLIENQSDDETSSTCSDDHQAAKEASSTTHTASPITNNTSTGGTSLNNGFTKCALSRPMQRKVISLIHCQLMEEEGRARSARIARSMGERIVSELLALQQFPHQLSANLWAAVRTRGCQFLGPAMQEEVLHLILLALEDGSFLSRKVLVLFVVQRLESQYPQASKTAIGHVVQLLYRASCFMVCKREEESSLMQLKEEFRTYDALRKEHDAQIVQIAIEAGLRISPEQWSSLLYGDPAHKSHMQSIIDKHQSPQSFTQSITELMSTLQRTSDSARLKDLQPELEFLSSIDASHDCPAPSWENLEAIMRSLNNVMTSFVNFVSNPEHKSRLDATPAQNTRYKTSMCRDFLLKGLCPRGNICTFAHSQDELDRYRSRSRRANKPAICHITKAATSCDAASLTATEVEQLRQIQRLSQLKLGQQSSNSCAFTSPPSHSDTNSHVKSTLAHVAGNGMGARQETGFVVGRSQCSDVTLYNSVCGSSPSANNIVLTQQPQSKGYDNTKPPTASPQTYFHPHNPGPLPHVTHMSSNCPHEQRGGVIIQPLKPPSMRTGNGESYFVPMGTMSHPPPVSPAHGGHIPYHPYGPPNIPPPGVGYTQHPHQPDPSQVLSPTPGHSAAPPCLPNNFTAAPVATTALPQNAMIQQSVPSAPPPPCQPSGAPQHCCKCQVENSCPQRPQPGHLNQLNHQSGWAMDAVSGSIKTPDGHLLPYPVQQEETLADLTTRKSEIISHLHSDPVFMGRRPPGNANSPGQEVCGLKNVIQNNKTKSEAVPKIVSDLFVATRSTQSLDEMRNEDIMSSILKWTNENCGSETNKLKDFDSSSQMHNLPMMANGSVDRITDPATLKPLPTPKYYHESSYKSNNTNTGTPLFPLTQMSNINSSSYSKATSKPYHPTTRCHSQYSGTSQLYNSLQSGGAGVLQTQCSGDITTDVPPRYTSIGNGYNPLDTEFSLFPGDDGDDYIPFEHTSVSKFGPISRMPKERPENMCPVAVTADSRRQAAPVFPTNDFPAPSTASRLHHPATEVETPVIDVAVKPTPHVKPSVWQQPPHPSYQNIALLKVGAAEAVSNNERWAYELQAVELEISMKTGKRPQPVGRMIHEAVMRPPSGSAAEGGVQTSELSQTANAWVNDLEFGHLSQPIASDNIHSLINLTSSQTGL